MGNYQQLTFFDLFEDRRDRELVMGRICRYCRWFTPLPNEPFWGKCVQEYPFALVGATWGACRHYEPKEVENGTVQQR